MSQRIIVKAFTSVALVLGVAATASAQTQSTPPPAQQQQAQPAEPSIAFTTESGMIFNTIKAANAADFEMVIGRIKEALNKSENPQRKQQAASWKVYKSTDPGPTMQCPDGTQCQTVMYIFLFEETVKGADYDPVRILSEAFPTEVAALYEKLKAAYAGLNKSQLTKLADMKGQ